MADNQTKLTVELEVILRDIRRKMRELDQFKRKLEAVANVRVGQRTSTASIDRQTLAAQRLALQQQRLELQQRRLAVQQQQVTNAQNRATQAAQRLTTANERLNRTVGSQGRVLQQAQRQLNSLGAAALRVGGGLRSVGASAAILVTGPLVALTTLAGRSAADIDAIRNRLIATEGSLEAANDRLAQLRKLADESVGVTRRTALDTFAILATLGDVTEDTINRQIRAFGRLNAAFTIDDQQLFFRNLLQIFQQGFEVKDIKEALGRVPIFNQILQQAFGTANPERLRELKAAGKLTLDTFLAGLATAVETDPVLGRIQESIRVRFQKTFERLTDALEPLGRAILGPLERIVTAIEPIILRLSAAFERLPPGVQTAIVVVGLLTAALGPVLFILGGIASGIGALATAAAAIIPILTAIGLPAILAILAGASIVLGELAVVVAAVGLAFQRNFLNVRKLTSDAANAVVVAFNRIRAIVNEVVQRILPTLRSITQKVLGGATTVWETYGATVVAVIRDSFAFVTGVIETFTRVFGNFIDLVLKLVDGDWRGAWRAFARIIVSAMDSVVPLLGALNRAVSRAFGALLAFIVRQAARFVIAAQQLAHSFIGSLVTQLILGGPQVGNAILLMFLAGITGLNFTGIATLLVKSFIAAIRRAAAEGELPLPQGPTVGVDVGSFNRRRQRRGTTTETETDTKGQNRLRRELDRLREAQDKLAEIREQGSLERLRSQIETSFTATKAGLDRELIVLEQNFDDRLVALRKYLKERGSLEDAQIDAEIQKELELSSVLFSELSARRRAAEKEFQTELREIAEDPKLKGQARAAATQTAEIKRATEIEKARVEFAIKHAESTARVIELEKQRKQLAEDLVRFERLITEEFRKQQEQLGFDLLEQQGRTADAEAGRLRARFKEAIRDPLIDLVDIDAQLAEAIKNVDLSQLQAQLDKLPEPVRVLVQLLNIGIKRAEIAELAQLVDNLSAGLRLDEQRIQNKVLDGLINQREAQAQIVALQQKYRATLLDILAGELAKAQSLGEQADNQAQILAIQAQIAEVERLGVAIDEAGQRINQALFQDLQSGLSGIFSGARQGFEGLRDAAVSFGERLLDTLNDIAATSILERIEGLFKPDATNTEGTIGGFFSKLFGLQPKQAADATVAATTLQTGATSAAATLTTSVATAGASFTSLVATAGASFASIVVAAASGVAAALGAGAIAGGGAGSGLAGLLGGAATGMFPAVPGGVYKFVEGGHPEAVLTTDPKYAASQVRILRAFLRETRGLGGRIKSFAAGGFISPHEAQSMLLSGLSAGPSVSNASIGELAIAGTPSMMRLRQVLVDQRSYRDWLTSSEGEQVIVDLLYRNQPVIRKLGGK